MGAADGLLCFDAACRRGQKRSPVRRQSDPIAALRITLVLFLRAGAGSGPSKGMGSFGAAA